MATTRDDAVESAERLLEALAGLRMAVRGAEAATRRALKMVETGASAADALMAIHPSDVRQSMNEALETAERARHDMRLLVFSVLLDQGVSIGELGRAFGISRQLAARLAREARSSLIHHAGWRPGEGACHVVIRRC